MKNVMKVVISGTALVAAGVVTKLYKNVQHEKKVLELANRDMDTYAETVSVNLASFYERALEREASEEDAKEAFKTKLICILTCDAKKMVTLDEETKKDVAILEIYKELFASIVGAETMLELLNDESEEVKKSIECAEKMSKEIADAIVALAWFLTK